MTIDSPLLSICVPTFNRAWLLERNVSFHLQAFRARGIDFEIVVVDDCSTDGTADYLAGLAAVPEVSVFRRHQNAGFLGNYAFAMRRARGRYAVFLGDDDLLIPDQVLRYLARMENDPALGVVQAPWMLVDARPGGGEMGPFYTVPGEVRFAKGDHLGLANFVLSRHVFPEFMIIRRSVLVQSIAAPCPFIFWAFLFTGRAQAHADILFLPEPFARVTAVSDDPRLQQGNTETMFQWDHYRGGIEYLVALAFRGSNAPLEERGKAVDAITRFMLLREKVALRLLVAAQHWVEAYVLIHRIAAYEPMPVTAQQLGEIGKMAGFATAAQEAAAFSAAPVILDPLVNDTLLGALKPGLRSQLVSAGQAVIEEKTPRAYLRVDPSFAATARQGDGVFDVNDYIRQYV